MEQSYKLQKPILVNRDGIWKIRLIHLDHMTLEILCTDLHEFWIKSVGVMLEKKKRRKWPHGGATTGLCEKCRAEVLNWRPWSVCVECGCDRANGG